MTQVNRPFAGPRRLFLIQSGKYDYAELDLTKPFQLVGVNGLGKTALISTLQYLYLDSQRDMRFGQHSTDESRKFYFRGEASFILFECETSIGTVTLGARSLGAASGYELQRFAWRGSFERGDFITTEGRPNRWDDVKVRLAGKDLKIINDNAELRRLLGAIDVDTPESWGIVPLADSRDYPRFRQTFQRLLQLRDIRQDDLKQLLADCANLGPTEREIDLSKDFERDIARIAKDRSEIDRLRKAEPLVKEVRDLYDKEYVARAIAHGLVAELQIRHSGYVSRFNGEVDALSKVREDARLEIERLNQESSSLRIEFKKSNADLTRASDELTNLAKAREVFADFIVEIEQQRRDRLGDEIQTLRERLNDLPKESEEVLQRQIEEKQNLLLEKETAANRLGDLFVTWLRERLPEPSIASIGALIDRRILESIVDEQIQISDEHALVARLKAIADRSDVRGYEDDALRLDYSPGALTNASKIGRIDRLNEEIRGLRRELERLEKNLETLRQVKPFKDRLTLAREELDSVSGNLVAYQKFREDEGEEIHLKEAHAAYAKKVVEWEEFMGKNEIDRREAARGADAALQKFETLQKEDTAIRREGVSMPFADGENPGSTAISDAAIKDLPESLLEVFRIVRVKTHDARQRATSLADKISLLDRDFSNTGFQYDPSATVVKRLKQLELEIASLPARSESIESRWQSVLTESRRSFYTILDSLRKVEKAVKKLNGELSKIEFSSISEVKLEVVQNQAAVSEYTRHSTDSSQPSLFDASVDADKKLNQFNQLLQRRPKLVLNDLFALRCEVRRKDGLRNFYDDFDQVESTGTTIVLKVTMNLLVLRDLLLPGKARIPFYLDEVHALDRQNFNNILQLSERLGFVGIYAAPTAAIGPKRFIHLVPDEMGRLVVTAAHQKDILKSPEEADAAKS